MTTSADFNKGEGSGGRPLAGATQEVTRWTQSSLYPPQVIQATLRVAWIEETHHLQVQIEVQDPLTGELLGMCSVPHRDARTAAHALSEAYVELRTLWAELTDPDPF